MMMTDPIKTQIVAAQEELAQIEEDLAYFEAIREFYPNTDEMTDRQIEALRTISNYIEKKKNNLIARKQTLLDFIKYVTKIEEAKNDEGTIL